MVGASVLVIYCIREYALDQDVTSVLYKGHHEAPDAIYPSITICFYYPFIEDKLLRLNKNLTAISYHDFLSGYDYIWDRWNSSLAGIDYDNVSIDFLEHLSHIHFNLLNNDNLYWQVKNFTHLIPDHYLRTNTNYSNVDPPEIYVSERWPHTKCFTLNIPFIDRQRIYIMDLDIGKSIFQNGIRPIKKDFFIIMHYPYQMMRSYLLSRVNWGSDIKETDCFELKVNVGSIEFLKRRNKHRDRCNADLKGHDNITLSNTMKEIGCSPSHWKIESDLQNCNGREQYRNIIYALDDAEEVIPPCRSITRLIADTFGRKCSAGKKPVVRLSFYFNEPLYKEIVVLRAYGFQSLIGNAGKIQYEKSVGLVFFL